MKDGKFEYEFIKIRKNFEEIDKDNKKVINELQEEIEDLKTTIRKS